MDDLDPTSRIVVVFASSLRLSRASSGAGRPGRLAWPGIGSGCELLRGRAISVGAEARVYGCWLDVDRAKPSELAKDLNDEVTPEPEPNRGKEGEQRF